MEGQKIQPEKWCVMEGSAASTQGVMVLEQTIPMSSMKVMVIDDSNTIRRSAEIFLKQAGCQVILAEDGFDALAKIADNHPHVIFVDIMMPRLDATRPAPDQEEFQFQDHASHHAVQQGRPVDRVGAWWAPTNI
jgi:hypothetical protein